VPKLDQSERHQKPSHATSFGEQNFEADASALVFDPEGQQEGKSDEGE
jgi:hypothetical protein